MLIERQVNLKELQQNLSEDSFYFWGAGNQGRRWAYFIEDLGVSDNCVGYIENDSDKHGAYVKGYHREYPIVTFDTAIASTETTIRIFITSLYYYEIISQIKSMSCEKIIECISVDEAAKQQLEVSDYDEVVKENNGVIIPPIIHYAWFGKSMPDQLKRNIDGWHKLCPDYDIIRWDESNYDVGKNIYMKEAYEAGKWGFVPDYLRLDIVYELGGIYLDTDIELVRTIDELRYQKCFGCFDASFTLNLGSGFGAQAGCEIIRKLRDYYDDKHFVMKDGSIDNTSCNTHSYHVLRKHGFRTNDLLQKIMEMNIYPMIFQGACAYTGDVRITDKTFWVHNCQYSWK